MRIDTNDIDQRHRGQRPGTFEAYQRGQQGPAVAWARSLTDSVERYSLEDVAAEFGVNLDEDEVRINGPGRPHRRGPRRLTRP